MQSNISPVLELIRVSVIRGDMRILDSLNLAIPSGQNTAILGPNGSGKTSLLNLLLRHFYPSMDDDGQQGTIRILGESLWDVFELRRRMGIVTASLDRAFTTGRSGRMTIRQAVASGINATQLSEFAPTITDDLQPVLDRAIARVGMQGSEERPLEVLSTGQRRRVMLARAIVHEPPILVLDEPSNGLDIVARGELLSLIASVTQEASMTTLLVTHHIEEIPPAIDHVILLDQGRIVFDGPKAEGLCSRRLSELYQTKIEVFADGRGWYHATLNEHSV